MAGEGERRDAVRGLYPGPAWARRVDNMTDAEIETIYHIKFLEVRQTPKPKKPSAEPPFYYDKE